MQSTRPVQGSHLYVLTVQGKNGQSTSFGTFTPREGWSRYDALCALMTEMEQNAPGLGLTQPIVLYFSMEPNAL
ncbi:hypothetical protein [Streptomyces sp. NRRL F-5135]|uniref:hypothetical protein n=1 Tax=Streptomyces sp. NRRL F-5135 TaxID=1463858 RepID=UPI0004C61D26|nr:hypothetical protein [Streptomyces sp. NRRL F-5135]